MTFFFLIIFFFFGLAMGSFLNVLIFRLNNEKVPKWWQGRSICPKCKNQLSWRDNIPLLSFVVLRGRCRNCRMKISWQYPVVELLTAVTTAVIWFSFPVQSPIVKLLDSLIAYCFIVIFFSDWIYSLIPDEMIAIGSFATAIYNLQFTIYNQFLISNFKFQISNLGQNLLVGILSGLGFLLVVVATRFKGMGLGDVKLAFLMGFLLGWPNVLIAFWAAFIIGGMVAIFLLLLKKVQFSDRIALGPYLVFGTVISALWSKEVWHLLGF